MGNDGTMANDDWRAGARATRLQAEDILAGLLRERAALESREIELGRTDPLREVTGSSALDRAIESVRAMIERVDDVVEHEATKPCLAVTAG